MRHFHTLTLLAALAASLAPASADPAGEIPAIIKLSSKVVISKAPLDIETTTLTPAAYDKVLRRAAQTKGTDLATAPSVSKRADQPATVKIIRTQKEGEVWDRSKPLAPFVGWILHFESKPAGKQIELVARIAHAFEPGTEILPLKSPAAPTDWDNVITRTAKAKANLAAEETLVIPLGELEPGRFATCFAQATPIDPSGRPVDDFSARFPAAETTTVEGIVRVRATLIENPKDLIDPILVLSNDDPVPLSLISVLSDDQLTYILKQWEQQPDLSTRELAAVEIPTGKARRPWQSLPGLELTTSLHSNRLVIDLDCQLHSPGGNSRTGISLYKGSHVLYQLQAKKPDTIRAVAIGVDLVD